MNDPRIIAVVTGTRADFGLLRPVMHAIDDHKYLSLRVIVTGAHLLPPACTIEQVREQFAIDATIEMQWPDQYGRLADAEALGRGVCGIAQWLSTNDVDVVLVLGDRIEAFAAAAAASVGGVRVAHMHGGDRAEGIADEALRHAISKLAHIHLAATADSAERLIAMGERPLQVHLVGSPAIDGLDAIEALPDDEYAALGSPEIVVLLHPTGQDDDEEFANAERLLRLCRAHGRTLVLDPNHDAGREGIMRAWATIAPDDDTVHRCAHLPREQFIGLLRRARTLVGNSSAGLIEASVLNVWVVNIGPRQAGRIKPAHVVDVPEWDFGDVDMSLEEVMGTPPPSDNSHPYGTGRAGKTAASILWRFIPEQHPLTKHNTY